MIMFIIQKYTVYITILRNIICENGGQPIFQNKQKRLQRHEKRPLCSYKIEVILITNLIINEFQKR